MTDDVLLLELGELSVRFESCGTVPEAVSAAGQAALHLLGADSAAVCRLEDSGAQVRVLHNAGHRGGSEEAWPTDETYAVDELPGTLLVPDSATRARRCSADDASLSEVERGRLGRLGRRHALVVQLQVGGRPWGQLYATREHDPAFDAEREWIAIILAGLLSSALARLELLSELSRLAYTDALTGLVNRRAADDWLNERLIAPEPFPTVGAVLCDINGMKAVNDRLGHGAGDELIRMVGAALASAAVELGDAVAARVGGDEFLLLAQGADAEQIAALANRLSRLELPHDSSLAVGAATMTTRPASGSTPEAAARVLLRLADAAQYRHKRTSQVTADAVRTGELPVSAQLPLEASGVGDVALARLHECAGHPEQELEERVAVVADTMLTAYGCAAWWLSCQVSGSVIRDVLGRVERASSSGDLQRIAQMSSSEIDAATFPATDHCLAGGSMFATLTAGHPTEREFLASLGYVSLLAAGDVDAGGRSWLLELYGDAQTSTGLFSAEPLLRALMHIAVTGDGLG